MSDNCVRCGKAKSEHSYIRVDLRPGSPVFGYWCPTTTYLAPAPEPEPKVIFEAQPDDIVGEGVRVFDNGKVLVVFRCIRPLEPASRVSHLLAAELARLWRRVQELEGK